MLLKKALSRAGVFPWAWISILIQILQSLDPDPNLEKSSSWILIQLDPTRKHCSRFSTHRRLVLWNRTVIICSGFGSRQYLAQFSNKTFVQNLSFAMPEAALTFRKLASPVWFFLLQIAFYVGSGSKSSSGSGTVMHSGSGSAKAKSHGSYGSGSTTLPRLTVN